MKNKFITWTRQVKIISTATYLMFYYICTLLIVACIYSNTINYEAYGVMLVSVFLMQYLMHKYNKKWLAAAVPIIIVGGLYYFLYPLEQVAINLVMSIVVILIFQGYEKQELEYTYCKKRVEKMIGILIFIGVITISLKGTVAFWIIKSCIVFLIFAIVLLREVRNYCNGIRNKKSAIGSISIMFIGILISTNLGYFLIATGIHYLYIAIGFCIAKIATAIFAIVYLPFKWIAKGAIAFILWVASKFNFHKYGRAVGEEKRPEEVADEIIAKATPNTVIIIFMSLVAIFVIYKLIKKANESYKVSRNNEVVIKREKIVVAKGKGLKSVFAALSGKLFKGEWDIRKQILYVYSKFQIYMKIKDIFRPAMTATQLSSAAKIKNYEEGALDSIRGIYNEAKFSKHQMEKGELEEIKEEYEKIRGRSKKTTFQS